MKLSTLSILPALMAVLVVINHNEASGQSLLLRQDWWHANDEVTAMDYDADNNVIYLGGKFTHLGPVIPFGASLDTMGTALPGFAAPNSRVRCAAPDGLGGYFIGGDFTELGGTERLYLAHLDGSGQLTGWNPGANAAVYDMQIQGSLLYIGGAFTQAGGQNRNRLAAIEIATAAADTWNPGADATVNTLYSNGTVLYVGGQFSVTDGSTRNFIASFNLVSAGVPLLPWNPNANGQVLDILPVVTGVAVAGEFTNIGGQTRNRIAVLNAATGLANAWNANANAKVNCLFESGGNLFAGGSFTNIGGQPRSRIASLNTSTGLATTWNPGANGEVKTISGFNSKIVAGGSFTIFGGNDREFLGAVHNISGTISSWNPLSGGVVEFISPFTGDDAYIGGTFHSLGGVSHKYLAALDANTGQATSWNPGPNSFVTTLAYDAGLVYAGGFFNTIGGQPRNFLAAIDAGSAAVSPWNPSPDNTVSALLPDVAGIYVGGSFLNIGGQPRSNIALLDMATGNANAWDANAGNTVNTLALSGTTIYAGGTFTNIGGQNRNFIAAVSTATGLATGWNPNANFTVASLAVSGTTVYAAGAFSSIGLQPRNYVAALSTASGFATPWNPGPDQPLFALAQDADLVFVGGDFTTFASSLDRNYGAALDVSTGFTSNWNPDYNNRVTSLLVLPDGLLVGGLFTSSAGNFSGSRHSLASYQWGCVEPDVPTLSASLDNACPGTSITLQVESGSVNDAEYWQWYTVGCGESDAGIGPFNTVSPDVTTTYYARGEGGCPVPGACAQITVNVIPNSFNVIDTIVCVQYTAPDGAVLNSTGEYLAVLPNAAGCDSLITINLIVDPAQTTGTLHVLASVGGVPIEGMKVEIHPDSNTPFYNLPSGYTLLTDANGEVSFEGFPAGNYVSRAVPNPLIPEQQFQLSTYTNEVFNWTSAQLLTLECYNDVNEEIEIIQLPEPLTGPGYAMGFVFEREPTVGMVTEPGGLEVRSFFEGDPIPGVPIILNRDDTVGTASAPSGNYFPFMLSISQDGSGMYDFDNLPEGHYRVDIDFFGLNMFDNNNGVEDETHYFHVLQANEIEFMDLNFYVDSTSAIYLSDTLSVLDFTFNKNQLSAFPNPFRENVSLTSSMALNGFDFELYGADGRLVLAGRRRETGFMHSFVLGHLPAGIYQLRILADNRQWNVKLIKQ